MSSMQINTQKLPSQVHWPSLIQLILSAVGALLLLGAAATIILVTVIQDFPLVAGGSDPTQSFMVAASLAFAGFLVLPSAWYAWKNLAHPGWEPSSHREPKGFAILLSLLVLLIMVGALWLGNWITQNSRIAWLVLPPLNIIATGLPALWLIYLGTRGLLSGTPPRRRWGVFASGLVLGPMLILVLELFVLIGAVILGLVWVSFNPNLSSQLSRLILQLQNSPPNEDAILRILGPFITHPGILFIGFSQISVVIPLIEEALKPIGVWLLAGQKLNPPLGFAYGVLSGAGFGLFENLGNTSSGGEAWALVATTRISTLLLHSLTAGMVGWALASAWSQKRYLRLGITYALAVILHGIWNGLAVLSAASSLEGFANISIPTTLKQIGALSAIGIVTLGAFNLVFYIAFNSLLQYGQSSIKKPSAGSNATSFISSGEVLPAGPDAQAFPPVLPEPPVQLSPEDAPQTPQLNSPGSSPGEDTPQTMETRK